MMRDGTVRNWPVLIAEKEVAAESDDQALVNQQRDPAARDHQNQRRDDRLDVEDGDQKAVPQSAQHARPERQSEDQGRRHVAMDQIGHHRAGDGDHRADRQIDALGANHYRHAQGHQGGRRAAIEHVDQAAERRPCTMRIEKNPGDTTPSTMKINARAKTGQNQDRLVRSPNDHRREAIAC